MSVAVTKTEGDKKGLSKEHEKDCFIAMANGRNPAEIEWFQGWYEAVIQPAVEKSSYKPILSVLQEQPSAINDEVRTHLAFDPMVVFDLGGMSSDGDPNPNVMYELGIRHAFGLPMVIMAWEGQRIPFNIGNQRTIVEKRGLKYIKVNKAKLESFIASAKNGEYYKPMEAIGRLATIEAMSSSPTADATLKALVQQFQEAVRSINFQLAAQQHSIQEIKSSLTPRLFGGGLLEFGTGRSLEPLLATSLLASGGAASALLATPNLSVKKEEK